MRRELIKAAAASWVKQSCCTAVFCLENMKDKYYKIRRPEKKEIKREREREKAAYGAMGERGEKKKQQCRFPPSLARVSCGNGSTDVILCAFTSSPLFPSALRLFSFLFVFLVSLAIFSFSVKPLFSYVRGRKEEERKKKNGTTRGRGKKKKRRVLACSFVFHLSLHINWCILSNNERSNSFSLLRSSTKNQLVDLKERERKKKKKWDN